MRQIFKISAVILAAAAMVSCSDQQAAVSETGELGWPEITQQNKPWTRWWWPASAVGQSDIISMLNDYNEANLGGMEVTTIYGVKGYEDKFIDYLSPEWMDLFQFTLDEAKKRDLGVDLANASGWPFGGNWVTPDYACRYLATRTYSLSGGRLQDKIEYIETPMVHTLGVQTTIDKVKYPIMENDSLQQYAYEQVRWPQKLPIIAVTAYGPDGAYADLTDKVAEDGTLDWEAPQGDWTICAMFLGWHGKMVERAGPGGEGDVIDHFSADAIDRYLKKFDEAFEGYDMSWLRYYFNDSYEVDDAQGNSDWTENMFEEFQARRGYDLKPYMLNLLGMSDDQDLNSRVLFDYRQTVSELITENYTVRWQQWAAKQGKGIRNQAHGSPANVIDLYAATDVPETEGRSIIGMKTASSAAHLTDKPFASSESATWLNEHFRSTLGDVKTAMDIYLLSGINHVFYHGTCLSPDDAPWPGWLFYASVHFQPTNSFWTDFAALNKYIAHCQSFLQAGKPDNDLLLFFNATDIMSQRGREGMLMHMGQNTPAQAGLGDAANYLYDKGYTWDYTSDKLLQNNLSASNGYITTNGGARYSAIIVPKCQLMLYESLQKLIELAKGGCTVIVEEGLPTDVPGLSNLEENRAQLKKMLASLKWEKEDGITTARTGKGRIMVTDDLQAAIEKAGITRETMYDLGLQSISRVKDDGGKYYFVKNPTAETIEGWIPLDCAAGTVGVYNPMTEEFGYGAIRQGENGPEVFMSILPDEAYLLETFAGEYGGEGYSFLKPAGEPAELQGEWTVTFTKGGPELPEPKTVNDLGSWTSYGRAYEIFSGTADYTIQLPAQSADAEAWSLDLGQVANSAAVYLDGEYLGTVISKPFAVKLTKEQAAKGGKLSVRVSNSMENRIRYLDQTGFWWTRFYNINFSIHSADSRGADGGFSAAGWPVKDSGLIGPVTLTPLASIQ